MIPKFFRDLLTMAFKTFDGKFPIIDMPLPCGNTIASKEDRWGTMTPPKLC